MEQSSPAINCTQCEARMHGPYCALCGRPQALPRIDNNYLLTELGSILNFQKGILFTIREILLRPGKSVRHFIHHDRSTLVKPIGFIIFCSLVYVVVQQIVQFEDGYIDFSHAFADGTTSDEIMTWISENYGFANIFLAASIALWVRLLFRRYGYNYYELLLLLFFLMGVQMLFLSLFGIIESVTSPLVMDIGVNLTILYITWGIARFFDRSRKNNYLLGLSCYFLGLTLFLLIAMALGGLAGMLTA